MIALIIVATLTAIASPLFAYWVVGRLKAYVRDLFSRAKTDRKVRNDLYSCLYFMIDMGPNVSAYSVVAIFIVTPDTWWQLAVVFVVGIAMKRAGRRLREKLAKMLGESK